MTCRESSRRLECGDAEAGHEQGPARDADGGAESFVGEAVPIVDEGLDEAAPCFGVGAEFPVLIGEIAMEEDGGAIIEWVREWEVTVDPLKAVIGKRQCCEEGRCGGHGVNRRAEVVQEAGQGERERARAATGNVFGLEDFDGDAGLCEGDGSGKTVGAGADDASALHEFIVPEFGGGSQVDGVMRV